MNTKPLPSSPSSTEPLSHGDRAIAAVRREAFAVGSEAGAPSYAGRSHPPASTLSRMIDALRLPEGARVLLVGSGSGYAAAALAQVCETVWAIERVEILVEAARSRLAACGANNVVLREGDGRKGWAEHAPFDAILVLSLLLDETPTELLAQLAEGAALVKPIGLDRNKQRLLRFTRHENGPVSREDLGPVGFSESLAEILAALGIADTTTLAQAEALARSSGRSMLDELRRLTRIDDADILRASAVLHGMNHGTLTDLAAGVDPTLVEQIPRAFCNHHQILPIARENGAIRVASTRPNAPFADVGLVFPGERIEPWLVTATDFKRLWSLLELRLAGAEMFERAAGNGAPEPAAALDLLGRTDRASETETRAVALFEALLLDAVAERASDVHLECYGDQTRVRLRVDGDLEDLTRYRFTPLEMVGLVNVIKIRSRLDISEKRLPQGGRCRIGVGDTAFDLRVQTQPSLHGEHVVIRILPQHQQLLTIEGLGFPDTVAKHYRRLLDNPGGLVLVVGPTGSGKSTTLYAALQVLARDPTRKVITIEDPIEYALDGIQQVQVRREIGFSFADAMRAFVREDPDVILVGEIRDPETALEALRASQTGHLVLSTLHCNDATDAPQRLFDLGMHPNSIASELLAVISQRLAKRICEECREPAEPDPALLAEVFPEGAPKDFRCFAGKGCGRCGGHGTRGRIAILEFMRATPLVRRAISRHVPVDEMRSIALDDGLLSARESALAHVLKGTIALEELRDVLPAERMAGEVGRSR